ncbi:hypothetical protein, partial [Acinetobacter baumannii]|uniref:hypothetical protein n=1 Tax=Acinetobacter baumannii TaxID=470 RepID=UPI00165289B9
TLKNQTIAHNLKLKINEIHEFSESEKFNKLFDEFTDKIDETFNLLKNARINSKNIAINSTNDFTDFCNLIFKIDNIKFNNDLLLSITAENSTDLFYEIVYEIIDWHNNKTQNENLNLDIINIYLKHKNEEYKLNIKNLEDEKNIFKNEQKEFEEYKSKANEKLETARNKQIITAFKNASTKTKTLIRGLYILIFAIFIIIIRLLFCRVQEAKKNIHPDIPHYFNDFYFQVSNIQSFDLQSFLYFLSLIISLTGLLAFLIKEKNSLTAQRDYFERCDTELNAFITYVSDFDPDEIKKLKFDLAKNYFIGGNAQISKGTTQDQTLTPENMKQILDILKELSKK